MLDGHTKLTRLDLLSPAGIESVRLQTDDRQNEVAAPNESVRKLDLGQLSRFLLRCTHAKLEKT